ncbi:hypothetical protein APHAL10511_001128 [Amanita phalloides]|nr:hypothetical protein APHAL10511_001128 [Amanita phalloides]
MSRMLSLVTLVCILIPSVSGLATPRSAAPTGWASNLEPYDIYHLRYVALNCYEKHKTPFFHECCQPFLASESPRKTLPSLCVHAAPSAISTDSSLDDGGCEEAGDLPSTTQGEDPVPTTLSGTRINSTHVPSVAARPSSAHMLGLSALASMRKHGHKHGHKYPVKQSSGSGNMVTGGFATYFYQNGNAGACGAYHGDYDLIAAIDAERYGYLGGHSNLCGKKVKILNPANNKSVVVVIADACPTCRNANSIDLSVGAFQHVADLTQGIVSIVWWFE